MNVGVCRFQLRLPENTSLKDKRRVLKSITTQLKNRFNLSVAEVGDLERWQMATVGVCFVSNNRRYTDETLQRVVNFVTNGRFDVEMLDYEIEIIPM